MAYSRLRVYYGPSEAEHSEFASPPPHKVTIPLGDVLPILADALRDRRGWVDDFLDDEITISTDLYEVLLAYEHYRRSGA
jgi:hypothetical protein